jgi:hypothetical protein
MIFWPFVVSSQKSGAGRSGRTMVPPNEGNHKDQYISLKPKRVKEKTGKLQIWHTTRKKKNNGAF